MPLSCVRMPAREGDSTAVGGLNSLAVGGMDIQAGVVIVPAPQVPAAKMGVDAAAAGRPDKVTLGGGLGLLLGAHGLHGGGGLP